MTAERDTSLAAVAYPGFTMGGSRCHRRREGWGVGRGNPLPTGGMVWGGGCAHSPENFSYFLLKIPYFDAFWHVYFLNHTPMAGFLTPPNHLLGTPLFSRCRNVKRDGEDWR